MFYDFIITLKRKKTGLEIIKCVFPQADEHSSIFYKEGWTKSLHLGGFSQPTQQKYVKNFNTVVGCKIFRPVLLTQKLEW